MFWMACAAQYIMFLLLYMLNLCLNKLNNNWPVFSCYVILFKNIKSVSACLTTAGFHTYHVFKVPLFPDFMNKLLLTVAHCIPVIQKCAVVHFFKIETLILNLMPSNDQQ